ncbi:MAG: hypothetical protein BWY89_00715 [Bacteroidetes bacterium ADurb.BinA012]|nr:MAG: hypothetical protein BWY89_00715 [Bacteroidetes bacterium ADurb.BinA012]
MCIAHFDIVAKNVVIADFKRADTGPDTLSLLQVVQVILSSVIDLSEFIQLLRNTFGDNVSFADGSRRIGSQCPADGLCQFGAGIQA